MTTHLYAYAKAYFAALSAGILYLATVIGPDITFSDFGHITLLHWIGFIASVLGVGAGTAAITNGPIQAKSNPDGSHTITTLPEALDRFAAPAPAYQFPKADVAAAEAAVATQAAPFGTATDAPAPTV